MATNLAVQASLNSCSTESTLHAVERIPSEGRGKAAQFIPIRFIFRNKLTKDDKLLVAFDAFVLAQAIGRDIAVGKIIHGDLRGCARESAANSEVSTPIHGASSIATDGTNPIGLFGPEMGSFASLIWYKASIAYEPLSNGNVRIRYWLNGVLRGTSEFPAVPYEADLVYLTIWAGEGSAWFDNVSVRSFAEITASANAQTNFVISWPAAAAGFDLVSATNANAPIWTLVSQPPTIVNGQNFVTNPIAGSARFFRLRNR
ncbi:MAG: hypothetical protein KIS67_28520 [Verrucomicrobiae bacterium]|nr:hypothetical protein [Verrucomicrobiae bacterium]